MKLPTPTRLPEAETRWSEIVHLITRGLYSTGEARKRAALRLLPLTSWGLLTNPERNSLAQALWHADYARADTLPVGTLLYDWVFLLLPEPESGLAEQRFRKKWLGPQESNSEKDLSELFKQLGNAFTNLEAHHRPLSLTADERTRLATMVDRWIALPVTSNNNPWNKSSTPQAIAGLQPILLKIDLSSSAAEALFAKVIALNQTSAPGFRLFNSLTKFLPNRLADIAMSMRMGLASDNVEQTEEAVLGLYGWLRTASKEPPPISMPPDDLLREIGVIIATRRRGVLNRALQVARWIFSSGTTAQHNNIAQLTLHGLRYLIEELRYDREHDQDNDMDVPLLRWDCARLALAMLAAGYKTDPTVARWAEIAQDDPLPEVRHAEGSSVIYTHYEILGDE
ncbi:MAG TPA: hypothetical protein DCZ04_06385 [Syntrophorhabdus aromaticivorans]|nr:hypothetical protein [Syntrophorhabdus aromaticivorans]